MARLATGVGGPRLGNPRSAAGPHAPCLGSAPTRRGITLGTIRRGRRVFCVQHAEPAGGPRGDRFKELDEQGRLGFKYASGNFVGIYSFLPQVVSFGERGVKRTA